MTVHRLCEDRCEKKTGPLYHRGYVVNIATTAVSMLQQHGSDVPRQCRRCSNFASLIGVVVMMLQGYATVGKRPT